MILSKYNLKNIVAGGNIEFPSKELFELPEKVLQFGTGVLLRGLPDYFIDKANRKGIFNGRVVVVKSTDSGGTDAFDRQDNLYTICVRGMQNGERVEENIISSAISRVLSANKQWKDILKCAQNPELKVIISNTTEVGIQLVKEDIHQHPPASFPAKLLAFLYERYQFFQGNRKVGFVIIPTELIPDNGKKLEAIILELAHLNNLEEKFIEWLECCNYFCNSLVDRIVPGKPDDVLASKINQLTGYDDELTTVSEVYRLWAIEGEDYIKSVLDFASADEGVIVTSDIELFRELKLRLLNGTHTLSAALAYLSGFDTVKKAMDDRDFYQFVKNLMLSEIIPAIPYSVDQKIAEKFALDVLDRFKNPEIAHFWISITQQYTMKMQMRVVPVLLEHYRKFNAVPQHIALGFSAYLAFMKPVYVEGTTYFGEHKGEKYLINDNRAAYFYNAYQSEISSATINSILSDTSLWGADLSHLGGFSEAVYSKMQMFLEKQALAS